MQATIFSCTTCLQETCQHATKLQISMLWCRRFSSKVKEYLQKYMMFMMLVVILERTKFPRLQLDLRMQLSRRSSRENGTPLPACKIGNMPITPSPSTTSKIPLSAFLMFQCLLVSWTMFFGMNSLPVRLHSASCSSTLRRRILILLVEEIWLIDDCNPLMYS